MDEYMTFKFSSSKIILRFLANVFEYIYFIEIQYKIFISTILKENLVQYLFLNSNVNLKGNVRNLENLNDISTR